MRTMMMQKKFGVTLSAALVMATGGAALAQPVIDGSGALSEYGDALYINTTDATQFGDNDNPDCDWSSGSEIDGVYGLVQDGVLYLMVAGNMETNWNKIELFFDGVDGGQNKLRGDNPDVDFNGLNRMGDDGSGNGMIFDQPFEADRYITVAQGDQGAGDHQVHANWAEVLTDGGGIGRYLGNNEACSDGVLNDGDNPDGIMIASNNSNTEGVTGDDPSGADLVDTGMEFAIPLSALGNPTGDIRVFVAVNGGGHDYLSNQVAGGVDGAGNLAEPRDVDFGLVNGDQFVTVPNGSGGDCLTLAIENLVGGDEASFTVSTGTPGQIGATVYGFQAGETKVANFFDFCATFGIQGVKHERVVGGLDKVFDGSGEIHFTVNIPKGASGKTVFFQSAEQGTCPDECMSNLLELVVQ